MEAKIKLLNHNQLGHLEVTKQLDIDSYITDTFLTNQKIWILQTWIGNLFHFEKALRCAIQRKLEVKIAILNPNSIHAKYRGNDLGITDNDYVTNKIWANLDTLERLSRENNYNEDFEVKLYDSSPTIGLYRLDNTMNLGFYWRNLNSTKGPNLVFDLSDEKLGELSTGIVNHFNSIWSTSDAINFRNENWKDSYKKT